MQHLFDVWGPIVSRLQSAKRILLLFDYDGTLTPIVDRPEQANLSSEARHVLRILSRKRRFSIGIISGRALNDLRNRVDVKGIIYAGNHGLEIKGPGMEFIHPLTDEIGSVINVLGKVGCDIHERGALVLALMFVYQCASSGHEQ